MNQWIISLSVITGAIVIISLAFIFITGKFNFEWISRFSGGIEKKQTNTKKDDKDEAEQEIKNQVKENEDKKIKNKFRQEHPKIFWTIIVGAILILIETISLLYEFGIIR